MTSTNIIANVFTLTVSVALNYSESSSNYKISCGQQVVTGW